MSINQVAIRGRLARDPRVRTTGNGKKVADFAIAVPRRYAPANPAQPREDLLRVRCWADAADIVTTEGAKGMYVELTGRIEVDRYKEAGGSADQIVIVVDRIEVSREFPHIIEDYQEYDPREVLNPVVVASSVAQHMGGTGAVA